MPEATRLMSDGRVRHYWDPEERIGTGYARALTNLEQGALWDVYLLFSREATWRGDSLPLPHLWMHQLRGFDPELRLDAEHFAAEAQRLLGAE